MTYGVIVVDDADDLRQLIVRALDRDGRFRVLADVGDGRQAIEAVHQHHPAVVLMDVSMPVMDGLTATRHLKRELPELRIVIFTGFADQRVEDESEAAGADGFLDKTTPLRELADTLARLLS